jgi:hypothetical protein
MEAVEAHDTAVDTEATGAEDVADEAEAHDTAVDTEATGAEGVADGAEAHDAAVKSEATGAENVGDAGGQEALVSKPSEGSEHKREFESDDEDALSIPDDDEDDYYEEGMKDGEEGGPVATAQAAPTEASALGGGAEGGKALAQADGLTAEAAAGREGGEGSPAQVGAASEAGASGGPPLLETTPYILWPTDDSAGMAAWDPCELSDEERRFLLVLREKVYAAAFRLSHCLAFFANIPTGKKRGPEHLHAPNNTVSVQTPELTPAEMVCFLPRMYTKWLNA